MTVREYARMHPEVLEAMKADLAAIEPEGKKDAYMTGRGDGIMLAVSRLVEMKALDEQAGLDFLGITKEALERFVKAGERRRTRVLTGDGKLRESPGEP